MRVRSSQRLGQLGCKERTESRFTSVFLRFRMKLVRQSQRFLNCKLCSQSSPKETLTRSETYKSLKCSSTTTDTKWQKLQRVFMSWNHKSRSSRLEFQSWTSKSTSKRKPVKFWTSKFRIWRLRRRRATPTSLRMTLSVFCSWTNKSTCWGSTHKTNFWLSNFSPVKSSSKKVYWMETTSDAKMN